MKANTKPAKPIDLSTCQIGQKLRLRNGNVVTLAMKHENTAFPYRTSAGDTYSTDGCYYGNAMPSWLDIIAILPLPKPKKPRATPAAPKMSKKEILKAITYFRGILQALEDQIKP